MYGLLRLCGRSFKSLLPQEKAHNFSTRQLVKAKKASVSNFEVSNLGTCSTMVSGVQSFSLSSSRLIAFESPDGWS
jgi:hypothetical protein